MTLNSAAAQLHEAAKLLAADDPDHARVLNGIGFSKADSWFGHHLVTVDPSEWSEEVTIDAYVCLRFYRDQLASKDINFDDIEDPRPPGSDSHTGGTGRGQVTAGRQATKAAAVAAEKAQSIISERSFIVSGSLVAIRWNKKDPEFQTFYQAVKAAGARWNREAWVLLTSKVTKSLLDALVGFDIPTELFAAVPEKAPFGTVEIEGTELKVTLTGYLNGDFNAYRALPGYRWARSPREVSFVAPTVENVNWLRAHDFTVPVAVDRFVGLATRVEAAAVKIADALQVASTASTSDANFDHLLPEGQNAYPFQTAGVEYALKTRRCLIADEMGLGKTIQALLTIEASGSFPAVVVCPATLKGNWVREINLRLPGRSVTVLSGRTANPRAVKGFDFVVVNYDILAWWTETLAGAGFNALVLDESHYAKEAKSKRTKAAIQLAQSIPSTGVRLCLTGTPILNRPKELVAQLQILDRLADVVGADKRNPAGAFLYRYCGPETVHIGRGKTATTFNGATNLSELNEKLRRTCYVRRQREEVLGLKNTRRNQIALSLNGALADYERAEENIIGYIRDELGTAAAIKAARAEILVRLNTLRRLSEVAKINATIEWVNDWLESYPTKSIIVFAEHVEAQAALVHAFPGAAHILAGEKDVEAQKEIFQSGKARVIVCSLKAAREGHTLTAASDVVFTSLGWTPGGLQQAEDRANRIGQVADQVYAWQLFAVDTIDEEIARLIEFKRSVSNAVINGEEVDVDDDILDGVIDFLGRK